VILLMIKEYGSVTAVVVTSLRKFVTIVASFLLFPKPFHANYITGAALIFVGIGFETYRNHKTEIVNWVTAFRGGGGKENKAFISPPPTPSVNETNVQKSSV
jgi:hypothetical protein